MSTSVDKSSKLIFNEFQKSISEVPLEVYYQINNADSYNSSGFQFNIRQPGTRALLDTDVWISYEIPMCETVDYAVRSMFTNPVPNAEDTSPPATQPVSADRVAFRSGYLGWRIMQNFSLQINNQTLTLQPYRWADVLNRLYISNEQSKHEFSTSGGEFDSGLHSYFTKHMLWRDRENQNVVRSIGDVMPVSGDQKDSAEQVTANFNIVANDTTGNTNTALCVSWVYGWHPGAPNVPINSLAPVNGTASNTAAQNHNLFAIMRSIVPPSDNIINVGFNNRFEQFALLLRYNAASANTSYFTGTQFSPSGYVTGYPNRSKWSIVIFERLPIPLFKMYSNDSVFGVIPNINTMQIQGTWINNHVNNFFRSNNDTLGIGIDWSAVDSSGCKLYLKWYTPPMNMPVPREISCPYPKITQWAKSINLVSIPDTAYYATREEIEYNITIESIPDLLLIYLRVDPTYMYFTYPDDFLMEIGEIMINIDNASGKLNQLHTIDLYNKWKRILKHSDSNIIQYDEWRKFCCVAALQPEDYGVRYGPGYSNQSVLGMKIQYNNWWNAPRINYMTGSDNFCPSTETIKGLLQVVCIYNRNRLILRADGSAAQELLKVAADFNAINTVAQFNDIAESAGRLSMA